jgi:fatty-acyl-CoA synthase
MAPTHVNPPDRSKKQCLGIPIFDTESMIVDPATLAELPPGDAGEIVSSGPQLFSGYWGNPRPPRKRSSCATARSSSHRRSRPRGRGGLFLHSRPAEADDQRVRSQGVAGGVEALMYGHPDIQEACVIAARDARRGETVKAVVVLRAARRGQVSAEEITAWAHGKMAAYKVPTLVEFTDSLPKSATGKVQWRVLQERENAKA